MCGICGFLGNFPGINHVFFGIEMLLNRGYDSSGICGIKNDKFLLHKYASTVKRTSINLLEDHKTEYDNLISPLIMHTRWATCGPKTDINAHPLVDYTKTFSIVHNGIIDNYIELRNMLMKEGIHFQTETDTEVIVNLISFHFRKCRNIMKAIEQASKKMEGTWAVSLVSIHEPHRIYCFCHEMPLLIGYGADNHFMMIASEQSAFHKFVDEYVYLDNDDITYIEYKDNFVQFSHFNKYPINKVHKVDLEQTPFPYEHWTLKEINDQPKSSQDALEGRLLNGNVLLTELDNLIPKLMDIKHLVFLGCGTSRHACLYVKRIFQEVSKFTTVQIFDGAEFGEHDLPLEEKDKIMLVFVSQSGETRDLYQCVDIGIKHQLLMIGVINVVDSLISRKMATTLYLKCGREVAVASTKAFINQVVVLTLLALWFGQKRHSVSTVIQNYIKLLLELPEKIKHTIETSFIDTESISSQLAQSFSLFLLGKERCEIICQEGSLKVKEIGYIHSEAFNSSALKHGPFSLLANNIPVIMIVLKDKYMAKNMGVLDEVLSRTPYVFTISDFDVSYKSKNCIFIDNHGMFTSLLAIIPLQLVAYHIALLKNTNPDKPVNLAKVITV